MVIKSLRKDSICLLILSSFGYYLRISFSHVRLVLPRASTLVSALGPGASLLALDPALLGDALLVEHVAGLLHELADGGVALAVLVGVVGSGGAVGTVAGGTANTSAGGGVVAGGA